ncbi:sigma-70 family RNA polymerase sigma factor [Pseudooceanicola sp. GBMRC 2024]|uniref:Sigma-70 family RNA polymerase sigma factor n=1 Tax=Pseudooceanicola albus TaxID=2692189 RepID=A0A6L7G0V1_9RHOB|nr:RNA polymerase sigma factor [Pseudooceanicola albus]MXN17964.1 sigma-70 family RNA polymerase sigma factor [Pseudooceanicola albus]
MSGRLDRWIADLFRDHHREMVWRAARLLGDRDRGEDAVQTTYARLVAGAAPEVANPRAYAITALRRVAFDVMARHRREWLYRIDFDGIEDLPGAHDTEAQVAARERVLRLAVLLNELPQSCSAAFMMNKIDGLTHREIAQRMGISTSMVEKHVMRALKHCREVLLEL